MTNGLFKFGGLPAVLLVAILSNEVHAQHSWQTIQRECRNQGRNTVIGGVVGGILGGILSDGEAGGILAGGLFGGLAGNALSCERRVTYMNHIDGRLGAFDHHRYDYRSPYDRRSREFCYEGVCGQIIRAGRNQHGQPCRTYYTYPANRWSRPQVITACRAGQGQPWMHHPGNHNLIVQEDWRHPSPPREVMYVFPGMQQQRPPVVYNPPPPPPRYYAPPPPPPRYNFDQAPPSRPYYGGGYQQRPGAPVYVQPAPQRSPAPPIAGPAQRPGGAPNFRPPVRQDCRVTRTCGPPPAFVPYNPTGMR